MVLLYVFGAARHWSARSAKLLATSCTPSFPLDPLKAPFSRPLSPSRSMSSGARPTSICFRDTLAGRFSLSAAPRAGHGAVQHHETHQVIPRYTDNIPAEYYKYGAFKNFRNDDSLIPNLVRSGAALAITFALCLLNDAWSCEHWHYKHRLAGSYLEAD